MNKKSMLLLALSIVSASQFANASGGMIGAFFGPDEDFVCYTSIHRNFFLAIFAAVFLAGLFAWSRFRLKSRTAKELAQQKSVIEEQNKDILDSIRYASRLQNALEPDLHLVNRILPESFFSASSQRYCWWRFLFR